VLDGDQAVGHRQLGIVVAVDADRRRHLRADGVDRRGDFPRHAAAVGVAQTEHVGARIGGDLHALERELGIGAVPVEEVLGVVDDLVDVTLQVADGVVDEPRSSPQRDAQVVAHVHVPALPEDGDHRRLGAQQLLEVAILAGAPRRRGGSTERRHLDALQWALLDRLEDRLVAGFEPASRPRRSRCRTRPTARRCGACPRA
jgi:hypothetical protein